MKPLFLKSKTHNITVNIVCMTFQCENVPQHFYLVRSLNHMEIEAHCTHHYEHFSDRLKFAIKMLGNDVVSELSSNEVDILIVQNI